MRKALEILALVCIPLAWGLLVELVVHRLLRARSGASAAEEGRNLP